MADRAIAIALKRRTPSEHVDRFRRREVVALAVPLRERLEHWAGAHLDTLRDARPEIPDALDDRAQDGWEPLLAIADAAGDDWPQRARAAALALSVGADREDESRGVRLLVDIQALFKDRNTERLPSTELVSAEHTAHRRLEDTEFHLQVRAIRSPMTDRAVGKLADAAMEAVDTLRSLLGAESETARLGGSARNLRPRDEAPGDPGA